MDSPERKSKSMEAHSVVKRSLQIPLPSHSLNNLIFLIKLAQFALPLKTVIEMNVNQNQTSEGTRGICWETKQKEESKK